MIFNLQQVYKKKRNGFRIHYRGGGIFWSYFRGKKGQFTWRSVAFQFWSDCDCLLLDPGLVQCISNCCVLPTVFFLIKNNVQVRHAQRMFQYPSWSYDYSMVKIEREYMEMKEKDDYWYSSYNSNSEVTKYFHLSTFKAILVT